MENIDKTHAILTYGLCERCNKVPGTDAHTCPYSEELYNDDTECNCCDNCCGGCADDI